MEIWKDIEGFEGLYLISNYGNIIRHPNAKNLSPTHNTELIERKPQINRSGYLYIDLCKNGKRFRKTVHQLVMAAFNPSFTYGMTINHKDGNKLNNHFINLEVCSKSYNELHKYANNLGKKIGISKYHNVSTLFKKYIRKDGSIKINVYYRASIKLNNKRIFCKHFKNEIEAAKAVDAFLDSIGDTIRKRNFPKP